MAGKRDRRRHATKSFSENVQVAETSYQMLEILKVFYVRGLKTVLTFSVNQKYNEAFRGVYFLRIREKKIQSNLVLVVILVLESKGLYF